MHRVAGATDPNDARSAHRNRQRGLLDPLDPPAQVSDHLLLVAQRSQRHAPIGERVGKQQPLDRGAHLPPAR